MSAVESAQQAARLTDPVGHGLGMLGMIGGAILGAVAAGVLIAGGIVTGGALIGVVVAGCVAGGGLAGGQLLRGIQRASGLSNPTTGKLGMGSVNVRIGSRPAARAKVDFAGGCNGLPLNHFPQSMVPIAEVSATVRINGMLAARVTSRLVCGAPIIEGKENVYIGGPTEQVLPIYDTEEWVETGLMLLGGAALVGGAVLAALAGGAALLGFGAWTAGGMIGFEGLGWIGDQMGPGWRDIFQGGAGLVLLGSSRSWGSRFPLSRRSLARQRQLAMLEENRGFNVSPTSWDKYPSIGRNGTYITDKKVLTDILGQLPEGQNQMAISKAQAVKLESAMGLEPGSLNQGFKIRQVDGIRDLRPRSPLEGNEYFLGPGEHLPRGGPEMVIDSVPTSDSKGVTTIMQVFVE